MYLTMKFETLKSKPVANLLKSVSLKSASILFFACCGLVTFQISANGAESDRFFETNVRPHLVKHCYGCHSGKSGKIRGGLRLDTKLGTLRGGNNGPAIVAHKLDESLLWTAINYEDFEMPPSGKLPADIIADFRKWIEMGGPDPRIGDSVEVKSKITKADIEQGRKFWSLQDAKIESPNLIASGNPIDSSWSVNEIDEYVLAGLAENGLAPAADADASSILRRLSLDLIGLPPSPKQVEWFSTNWKRDPEKTIDSVVDSLLNSDRFGERWGRHWLDVARYAESSGKEQNLSFPNAWRYRDYVIDSFNKDKPYDRFVQEQIAGDLLKVKTDEQWAENLIATGFLAIGPKTLVEQNQKQFQLDVIDEQIDAVTRVFLGLSVACARCHDHKFDPIPQTDYYAMAGMFQSTTTYYGTHKTQQNRNPGPDLQLPIDDNQENKLSAEQYATLKRQLAEKRTALRKISTEVREIRSSGKSVNGDARSVIGKAIRMRQEVGILQSRVDSYDENGIAFSYCMATQPTTPTNATLFIRGDIDRPGQQIERGFLQLLSTPTMKIPAKSNGRLELSQWMTNESCGLLSRVMVNRIWLHLFGEGLVRSPEDFGMTGQPPTHPLLLDYLAVRFMENGWSVKKLIREIVASRTYRMNSAFDSAKFDRDPENKYLWRHSPRRFDAEVIRDSILSISKSLDVRRPRASLVARVGPAAVRNGILVTTTLNEQGGAANSQRTTVEQLSQSAHYRSVYLPVIRDYPPRALELFDFAEASMVVGKRESSNTPDQGLFFLNNPFVLEQSDAMARRLVSEAKDLPAQVALAFRLAYCREAKPAEIKAALKFVAEFENAGQRGSPNEVRLRQLSFICQSIISTAEFRYSR
jgi:hypothetical protein